MKDAGRGVAGSMAALLAGPDEIKQLIRDVPEVQAANWNGPRQTVIAGPTAAVKRALDLAGERGIQGRILPVSSAFHTPLVASAREPVARIAGELLGLAPDRPVYSNIDAAPHPASPAEIAVRLGDHLAGPVRFADMIQAMHTKGARVFVEVGPGSILTSLVESILKDRPHLAVSCDPPGSSGLTGWLRTIARLVAGGVRLSLEPLTAGRASQVLDLEHLPPGELTTVPTASTWLVNGTRARPYAEPEQNRLGQALPPPAPVMEFRKAVASNGSHHSLDVTEGQPKSVKPGTRPTGAERNERIGANGASNPQSTSQRNGKSGSHIVMKTPVPSSSSTDRVIESFQQTMQAFLEVQRSTMLAYLTGRGSSSTSELPAVSTRTENRVFESPVAREPAPTPVVPAAPPAPVDDQARHGGSLPEHGNGAQNGHGYESHRANGNGKRSNGHVSAVPAIAATAAVPAPPAAPAARPDRSLIATRLLETVRDRTGYPIETLGLDLDMEADLGIDSIKRVEILGKMRDEFPHLKALSDSPEMMDAMARARTLGVIVDR